MGLDWIGLDYMGEMGVLEDDILLFVEGRGGEERRERERERVPTFEALYSMQNTNQIPTQIHQPMNAPFPTRQKGIES